MVVAVVVKLTFPEHEGRKGFILKTVSTFKVESSWQNLTSTAEIVIAKKMFFEEKGKVFELIRAGDPFELSGGYDGVYNQEFKGFVSEILDDMPVVLNCEDNMYILKRTSVNKSYSIVTLKQLLKDLVPGQFSIDCADINLGSLLLKKTTVSQVLQSLKDDYGIYSYFVGDTLVSGKIYLDNPNNQVVKYSLFGATNNVIKNDLKYRRLADILIKVTMTSHLSDGKKKSVTVGDAGGQEQKLVCANITDTATLTALATKEYKRLKIDGYNGTITTFAIPFVKHGYTASMINKEYPEKDGDYYIEGVTTQLNDQGAYHRTVRIGKRAAKQ